MSYGDVFGWQAQRMGEAEAAPTLFRLPGYVGGEPQQPVPRDVVAVMFAEFEAPPRWSVDFWVSSATARQRGPGSSAGRSSRRRLTAPASAAR